jgi:hypothetical protein
MEATSAWRNLRTPQGYTAWSNSHQTASVAHLQQCSLEFRALCTTLSRAIRIILRSRTGITCVSSFSRACTINSSCSVSGDDGTTTMHLLRVHQSWHHYNCNTIWSAIATIRHSTMYVSSYLPLSYSLPPGVICSVADASGYTADHPNKQQSSTSKLIR